MQPIEVTVGADPEFFLHNGIKLVSAHDKVPGTKKEPFALKDGVCIQADGTAVEFNIRPAKTGEEFAKSIASALDQIQKLVGSGFAFKFKPSVQYPKHDFDQLPNSATELGCSPDFSADRNGRVIFRSAKILSSYRYYRMGGGHIHVGWGKNLDPSDPSHIYDCVALSQAMKNYFMSYKKFFDSDVIRQCVYGSEGAFRPKPYGVEFRALSNAWLNYPELWPWIFDATVAIFRLLQEGKKVHVEGVDAIRITDKRDKWGQYIYVPLTQAEMIVEMNKRYAQLNLPPMPVIRRV